MFYRRFWLKVGASVLVAGGTAGALIDTTRPPALHSVAVLTTRVSAMHAIPAMGVHWTAVASPPPHAITSASALTGLVAQHNLGPGTMLVMGDFTAPQVNHLKSGEVQWLVSVSAAASGLPTISQRVDVWSGTQGSYQEVAHGVRVVGLYTSSGKSVGSASHVSSGNSGSGLVALAVPTTALASLLNVTSPTLVVDPNAHQFTLTTHHTAKTTSKKSKKP